MQIDKLFRKRPWFSLTSPADLGRVVGSMASAYPGSRGIQNTEVAVIFNPVWR